MGSFSDGGVDPQAKGIDKDVAKKFCLHVELKGEVEGFGLDKGVVIIPSKRLGEEHYVHGWWLARH